MAASYYAFDRSATSTEASLQESVAVVTQTLQRSPFAHKIQTLLARIAGAVCGAFHGSSFASNTYSVRHAQETEILMRMARNLENSQPELAAELMLQACH
jgi:hypothetical protein